MNKENKNQVESELLIATEEILKRHNQKAAAKVKKHLKEASKKISKKFYKAVKTFEKENNNIKKTPVKKLAKSRAKNPTARTRTRLSPGRTLKKRK